MRRFEFDFLTGRWRYADWGILIRWYEPEYGRDPKYRWRAWWGPFEVRRTWEAR